MQDIHDIYGPYEISFPLWFVLLVAFGFILLLATIFIGIYFYRKHFQKEAPKREKIQRKFSPEENLHIATLKLKKDLRHHFADEISKKLSQEIRIFLNDAKYTDSLKKTTNETRRALKKTDLGREKQELILEILKNADGIKFAERDTTREKVSELLDRILEVW